MIPIRDINKSRSFPLVNIALIVISSLVWLFEAGLDEQRMNALVYSYGLVPAEVFHKPYTLLTHMFLHGSWLHIIGNMWFLWVFGDNVEDRLGKVKYLIFYLLSGAGAAFLQTFVSFLLGGTSVPMVGASGAISGVMGAYLWMFPYARILSLVPVFFVLTFMEVPAVFFIGLWIIIQVINGILTLPFAKFGGVAWFAHIGGFGVGYILARIFYKKGRYYF
ncbi:MAG: rhomboid family intramembrane serine protease [Aquificaceae bacterium]